MNKVIIIGGPTASGKSTYALSLALKYNGEIVSADSAQIYKKMNIGTAKPSLEQMKHIKHHMIDIVDIDQDYSTALFKQQAEDAIQDILDRGKLPIVAGGTGLYIDALLHNYSFNDDSNIDEQQNIAKYYEDILKKDGKEALYKILYKRDKVAALSTHPNNVKRVLRYLCILHNFDGSLEDYKKQSKTTQSKYDYRMFIINKPREQIYADIDLRVDEMIEQGLIQEVEQIFKEVKNKNLNSLSAIGYKEIIMYLRGFCTLDTAVRILKQNTRNYAKRQLTWLSRYKNAEIITNLESLLKL